MAHKITKPLEVLGGIPPVPKNANEAKPMLAFGGTHILHLCGKLGGSGTRTSLCRLTGAFYEPPPDIDFPHCTYCYGAQKS